MQAAASASVVAEELMAAALELQPGWQLVDKSAIVEALEPVLAP